jgi:o-succinylbenzoate synthase
MEEPDENIAKTKPDKAREYAFSWRGYAHNFAGEFMTSHGSRAGRRGVIVRLSDSRGALGYGEMAPLQDFGGPDAGACMELCRSLGAKVPRSSLSDKALPGYARFAFGSAVAMLEGRSPRVGRWPLARLLPRGPDALFETGRRIRMGSRCFKYKLCGLPDADERQLVGMLFETLRNVGGRLRLDVNGGLSEADARECVRWLSVAGAKSLDYLEQPMPPGCEDAMLDLMRDTGVPVALDESVAGMEALKAWMDWPGPLVVKPALAGNPIELGQLLDKRPGRVILSSSLESPVGLWGGLMSMGLRTPEPLGYGVGVWPPADAWGALTDGSSLDTGSIIFEDMEAVWNGLCS